MSSDIKIPFSYERVVRSNCRILHFLVISVPPFKIKTMQKGLVVCFVILIAINCVASRWLPTRSQEDRVDKLREMLKDLLESEIERSNYESKNIFKRDVGTQVETIETAASIGRKEKLLRKYNLDCEAT